MSGGEVVRRPIKTIEELKECVQLVHRERPRELTYVRSPPRSILFPSTGQLETRVRFGEAAKKAKGMKGLCPCHGLPWAAHFVRLELKGFASEERVERLPIWRRRAVELSQLRALATELRARAVALATAATAIAAIATSSKPKEKL